MLFPETRYKFMIHAPTVSLKGKGATFVMVLMTADLQLRKRGIESFCDNSYPHLPTPPKKKQPRQKAIKENSLVLLSKIMASGRGIGGEELSFL